MVNLFASELLIEHEVFGEFKFYIQIRVKTLVDTDREHIFVGLFY